MSILTCTHLGRRTLVAAMLLSAPLLCHAASFDDSSEEDVPKARIIVEKADAVRQPATGFQVDVDIVSHGDGIMQETRSYRVLSKGNENTVVMTLQPAVERGQILLMKSRDLWVFMPEVSQPVRISLAQRLTGQVANGDLARANFAGDYHPRILRSEVIGNEHYDVLELKAIDRSVTYPRVLYWVNQKNFRPYKAEFYSLSNRLMKTCRYENFMPMAGKVRPTRLIMEDPLHAGNLSILKYNSMKLRDLPDKVFTKEYLKKLN